MTDPASRRVTAGDRSPHCPPGSLGERLARFAYSLAWALGAPIAIGHLLWRGQRQPAYRRHWRERFGLQDAPAPARPRIWVHAVSVGETRAVAPLVDRLLARYPDHELLLTNTTPTGREAAHALFGARVRSCYLPYDGWAATRRFLRREAPRIGILIETEVWPNLSAAAARAGVPLVLASARLSERSLARGLRWACLIQPALARLTAVFAQTPADAARIERLGRADVAVLGNLKFDVAPDPDLVEQGRRWRHALAGRRVVLAASTRDGEEIALARAWRAAPPDPRLLLVLVPRHPQRFDAVARDLQAQGLTCIRRSRPGGDPAGLPSGARDFDVLLGDSMGEMPAYYALADVAIIGGSLLPFGGQNLIEACAQGVPVVLGPHTFNFEAAAEQACAAGAGVRVSDAAEAVRAARQVALDEPLLERMRGAATAFAAAHRGAADRTLARIEQVLDGAEDPA